MFQDRPRPREVFTVSRLNREVRGVLEQGLATLWLEGEISNLSRPASGHWYFTLKDAEAQVRAAMFRQRNRLTRAQPRDGQHVLIRGRVTLYEPRGEFQLVVDHMEDAGVGALQREFERIKAKLAAEGLFAAERKRSLPRMPRRIGIVTSPSGAAVRDVLHVLARRFAGIPVIIYPASVQGTNAPAELVAALQLAHAQAECDVLILTRGGGSLEDLWAFNDEALARCIASSPIPLISGVGHEIDFTIADFAADVRAPTPSAAAELAVPDGQQYCRQVAAQFARLEQLARRRIAQLRERLVYLQRRTQLASPTMRLAQQAQRLDEIEAALRRCHSRGQERRAARLNALQLRLERASPARQLRARTLRHQMLARRLHASASARIARAQARLAPLARTLSAIGPLATLSRGYAIVKNQEGAIVRDVAQAPRGSQLEIQIERGALRARVE